MEALFHALDPLRRKPFHYWHYHAITANMNRMSKLATFQRRWHGVSHDLGSSHSQTLSMAALWALATPEEQARWAALRLDYAAPAGAPALRARIAARYRGLRSRDVVCCAGAQEGMASVMRALLAPGDHVVVVLPVYQPLEEVVT